MQPEYFTDTRMWTLNGRQAPTLRELQKKFPHPFEGYYPNGFKEKMIYTKESTVAMRDCGSVISVKRWNAGRGVGGKFSSVPWVAKVKEKVEQTDPVKVVGFGAVKISKENTTRVKLNNHGFVAWDKKADYLIKSNLSIDEVAAKLGVSEESALNRRQRLARISLGRSGMQASEFNFPLFNAMGRYTPEAKHYIKTEFERGVSSNILAKKFKITRNAVIGLVHRNSTIRRPKIERLEQTETTLSDLRKIVTGD